MMTSGVAVRSAVGVCDWEAHSIEGTLRFFEATLHRCWGYVAPEREILQVRHTTLVRVCVGAPHGFEGGSTMKDAVHFVRGGCQCMLLHLYRCPGTGQCTDEATSAHSPGREADTGAGPCTDKATSVHSPEGAGGR